VRVVVFDRCPEVLQQFDRIERWRLADIRDVGLVGDTEDEYLGIVSS
jgi:hypothetical protein